jgi:hypothetical protein
MKIEVEIKKKYFLTIVGIILLLGVAGIGVAYNSNPADPAVFGHSADEIAGLDGIGGDSVPMGTIALFDSACPSGWTHFAELDDRFPLGSNAGSLGTAEKSTWTSNTGKTSLIPIRGVDGGDAKAGSYPNTYLQVPYRKVVYCEKTSGGLVVGTTLTQDNCRDTPYTSSANPAVCNVGEYVAGLTLTSSNDNEHVSLKCCSV